MSKNVKKPINFSIIASIVVVSLVILLAISSIILINLFQNKTIPNQPQAPIATQPDTTNVDKNEEEKKPSTNPVNNDLPTKETPKPVQQPVNLVPEALVYDDKHDVFVIKECDLAIRFDKDLQFKYSTEDDKNLNNKVFGLVSASILTSNDDSGLLIQCVSLKNNSDITNWQGSSLSKIESSTLPFLAPASFSKVTQSYIVNQNSELTRYLFATSNYLYSIKTLNQKFAVNLQFNSLSPSEPSLAVKVSNNNSPAGGQQLEFDRNILELKNEVIKLTKLETDGTATFEHPACGSKITVCRKFIIKRFGQNFGFRYLEVGLSINVDGKSQKLYETSEGVFFEITKLNKIVKV